MRCLTSFCGSCNRQSVAGASHLQVRSRGVAAFTAVWLLLCGVLAGRHEAIVGHVRTSAGAYVHGSAPIGHHESGNSDIHGQRNPDADPGVCALLSAYHQPVSAHVTRPTVLATVAATHVHDTPSAVAPVVTAAVYRLAPKTSPPATA